MEKHDIISEKRIRALLREELTKREVKDAVKDEFERLIKEREFEKRIQDQAVKVMEKFIDGMFARKSVWKDMIR